MVNYNIAFKRPFTDIKKLIIGLIISIIPIVNFIATGYHLECAKTALSRKFKLPEWKNFGKLFVNGFLGLVISFVYLLPAILIFIIFGISILRNAFQGGFTSTQLLNNLATLGGIASAGFILMIIAFYIIPAALVGFIESNKFGDGFNRVIFRKAFTGKYFIVWLIMGMYMLILGSIFSLIPFVGGSIAGFITGLTLFTAVGEIYKELK